MNYGPIFPSNRFDEKSQGSGSCDCYTNMRGLKTLPHSDSRQKYLHKSQVLEWFPGTILENITKYG